MDLAVLIILIIVVIVLFKDVKWFVYLMGIIEIFLRIMHYIGDNLGISEINSLIDKYLPDSIFSILGNYTSGIVYQILSWILVIIFIWFLFYLIRYFIKKK